MSERKRSIDPKDLISTTAKMAGLTADEVLGPSRNHEAFLVRRDIQLQLRERGFTFDEIGIETNRDKSTVIHNVRRALSERPVVGLNRDAVRAQAESFLADRFPGVNLDEAMDISGSKRYIPPRQGTIRHLVFDQGLSPDEVSYALSVSTRTVAPAIAKSEEKFSKDVRFWQRVTRARERLSRSKERREQYEKARRDRERRNAILQDLVLRLVAEHYLLDLPQEILSKSRKKHLVQPRKTVQYILFKTGDFSYHQISNIVGRKNHTSAMYAISTVERRLEVDPEFKERIEKLIRGLNALADEALKVD